MLTRGLKWCRLCIIFMFSGLFGKTLARTYCAHETVTLIQSILQDSHSPKKCMKGLCDELSAVCIK